MKWSTATSRTGARLACATGALVVLALAAQAFGAAEGGGVSRGGARTIELTGGEALRGVTLPDSLIVAGTDSVFVDRNPLVRGADYVFDAAARRVDFIGEIPDSAHVLISYLRLPPGIPVEYRRAVMASPTALPPGFSEGARLVERPREGAEASAISGLRVGGAKTFGITVGSDRDPSLEQSLRLSVSGRVGRDVRVNAYLSDQNTPLVPEGDTEELRALDRVLVEIEGENASARMGDYQLVVEGGPLARVRRDVAGAMATGRVGPADILLAGASSDGEFRSLTFRGVDGRQGPYLLTDASGASGVAIVAGSESVWIDGERARRGRDNDYVIDYSVGEIEFTERRPVTSDNEITVDYEYALSDYDRSLYAGRVTMGGEGPASGGISYFHEADDRNSPLSLVLTEATRTILEAAGDDASLAHDSGVDSVGVGEGDYDLVSPGEFMFVGADVGTYLLSFERTEGGDYTFDYDVGHYVYVGQGEGEYRLGRSLPLPTSLGLLAADGRIDLPSEGSVVAGAALSDFDRNTFSDIDDRDNAGNAEVVSGAVPRLTFGGERGGTLGLSLDARRVGGSFRGIGRFRDVRYEEKWELEGLAVPPEELMVEGEADVALAHGGALTVSHGSLSRGDALDSRKTEFSLAARPSEGSRVWAEGRFVNLDYDYRGEASVRERRLYAAGAEQTLGFLRPGVRYRHDSRSAGGAGGERYDEYGGTLADAGAGAFGFSADYAYRLTDRSDGASWNRASTTTTQNYRLAVKGSEALSVEAGVLHRVTRFEEGFEEPGSRYDLASLRANHRSFGGALDGEVRYSVTSTEIEEKERHTTTENGVEVTRIVSTGRFFPVTDLAASTRWAATFLSRAQGGKRLPEPSGWRRFLSGVALETNLKLSEITTSEEKTRLYLLDPSILRGKDTVDGELTGRHVARYTAPDGRYAVRLTVETRDALDRRYLNTTENQKERSGTVDVKVSPGTRVTYHVAADLGRRSLTSEGAGDTYEIDSKDLLVEATSRSLGDVELRLTASGEREHEALAGVDVTEFQVTPALTYRFAGRGTATASLTRTDVRTSEDALPLYLAGGQRPGVGTEWRVSGDYRLNTYLTASLSYTGERMPDSPARHTLDVRVNAFF